MEALLVIAGASAAIFVFAGAVQAVTGFGSALVSVPLLSLFVDTGAVVVGAVAVATVVTGFGWWRERAHVDREVARRLSLSAVLGLPLGLLAMVLLSERSLTLLVAVVVLVLVAALARDLRLPSGTVAQRCAGVTSGALLTSTSMNGPPLVLVLHGARLGAHGFRATLQAVFCFQGLLGVAGFALLGYVGPTAAAVALGGWCGVPVGWLLGDRIFHRIDAATFGRLVLAGLAVTAMVALANALW